RQFSHDNGRIATLEERDAMGRVVKEETAGIQQGMLWLGGQISAVWSDYQRPFKVWHLPDGRTQRMEYGPALVQFDFDPQGTTLISLGQGLVLRAELDTAGRVRRQALTRRSALPSERLGAVDDPNVLWWGRYEYDREHVSRE